jgi:hypothetical protein
MRAGDNSAFSPPMTVSVIQRASFEYINTVTVDATARVIVRRCIPPQYRRMDWMTRKTLFKRRDYRLGECRQTTICANGALFTPRFRRGAGSEP